jgi:hypothetical protein
MVQVKEEKKEEEKNKVVEVVVKLEVQVKEEEKEVVNVEEVKRRKKAPLINYSDWDYNPLQVIFK